ncbi:tRNA-dihydrouridine synthase [bacterium]|nr:tRNA-dihydrouridine synthase [bacterium]
MNDLIHPLTIGSVVLPNNLILAPMAGVTDGAFRSLCSSLGAGFCVSELVSAKGILMGSRQTLGMIDFPFQKRPFAIQLFGESPEVLGEAAAYIEERNLCDVIDINMGCPVSKIVKNGAGCALMKTPKTAKKILETVVRKVRIPVSMKCRLGWNESNINVVDFVKMAMDTGVKAITVHARTRDAGYSGLAQWKYLENLQDVCGKIPLIGNGDIATPEDIAKIHEISGCQGFMIGRGSIGRPWIFSEMIGESKGLDSKEKFGFFRRHFVETLMEHGAAGVLLFRVHLFAYLKGHPGVAAIRKQLCFESNPAVILSVGKQFFEG